MPSDDDIPFINRAHLKWNDNDLLGEGSFGRVFRGQLHGTPVAIKVVKRAITIPNCDPTNDQRQEEIAALKQHRREIHRFKVVQNPHIIQYLGVFRDNDPRDLYIVTEYLEGGSLHDSLEAMRSRGAILYDRSFLQIARHIAYGLNHVHAEGYTHGDVKPQNILLSSRFQFSEVSPDRYVAHIAESVKVKIADFGLSKRLNSASSAELIVSTVAGGTVDFGNGPCGTLLYMSPEGYHGIRTLSDSQAKASDIYAYGLVLYELLTGLQSWQLERVVTPYQLFALVNEGRRPSWGVHREQIDPRYVQLVEACWSGKCEDRPTADEIILTLNDLHSSYEQSMASAISSEYTTSESQMTQQEQVEPVPSYLEPDYEKEYESSDPVFEAERKDEYQDPVQEQATSPRSERGPESPPKIVNPPLLEGAVIYEQKLNNVISDPERSGQPEMNLGVEKSGHEGNTQHTPRNNNGEEQVSADDIRDAVRHVDSQRIVDSSEASPPSEQVHYATNPQLADSGSDYEDNYTGKEPSNTSQVESDKVDVGRIQEEFPGSIRVQSVEAKLRMGNDNQNAHNHHPMGMKEVGEGDTLDEWEETENNSFPMPEIRKVESEQIIKKPSLRLGIPTEGGEGASYGLQLNLDPNENGKRSQTDIINSFLRAAAKPDGGGPGVDKAYGSAHGMGPGANPGLQRNPGITGLAEFAKPALKPPTPHLQLSVAFENLGLGGAGNMKGWVSQGNQTAANQAMGVMQSNPSANAVYQQMADQRFTVTSSRLSQDDLDMLDQECVSETVNGQALVPAAPSNGNQYTNGQIFNSRVAGGGYNVGHGNVGAPNLSNVAMIPGNQVAPKPPHMDRTNHPNRMGEPYNSFSRLGNAHATMGMPSLMTSMTMGGGPPRIDESVVEVAMQHPNGLSVLYIPWQNGHCRSIANSFSACKSLRGEYALTFVCQLLQSNNELVESRRDRIVARDLCTSIGNLVRNSGYDLESEAVLRALALILSSMSIFSHDKDLYAACTYALCNLLKVQNVINDMSLRQTVATWISYCIMWNLSEGNNRGPKWNILAYSATCAARNLMWLNETNISTFLSASSNGMMSPIANIMNTISLFDYLRQRKVVEACMSTLATAVYYPIYRTSFAQQQGFECVSRIAEQYAITSPKLARLSLCVLGVALAGPHISDEAVDAISKAFLDGRCVGQVMHVIEMVQQQSSSLDQLYFVELLESGYSVVLAAVSLGVTICQILSNAGIGNMIVTCINDIARCNRVLGRISSDPVLESRQNLIVTLCDTVSLICCEQNALHFFRESRIDQVINELCDSQSSVERVVQSCQSALGILRAYY